MEDTMTTIQTDQVKKLTIKEKLGFSAGEYAGSMVWQALMFFLPIFYTDTFGLSAAAVSTMFLVVRLFDAFNDPIMGMIFLFIWICFQIV